MQQVWRLFSEDPDERERFADLATTLSQPAIPAGPPNRLRQVKKITVGDRTWYLKTFTKTQWKNRLHFQCTRPRAADDAERELLVTEALRQAGIHTPRPVAYGRSGPTSYYLCAELEGRPAIDCLDILERRGALVHEIATVCGDLLRRGFWLPDLSADHVFVTPTDTGWALSVLDLHNGRIAAAGPPPLRVLRRVLRRFARSIRGAPITPRQALAFAARLLREAGRRSHTRQLVQGLPPLLTAARYEVTGKGAAYAGRNPVRARRETALLQRVWPGRRGERVLDLPCGAGRLLPFLRDDHGHHVIQGDGALAMLRLARAANLGEAAAVQADALALPFGDRTVDGAVMFRFLHHLPQQASRMAIGEACRVADRFVVVSFFHPCSFHHLQRRFWRFTGRPPTRFARRLSAVKADFAGLGFALDRVAADFPYARDLWVASFVRC